MTLIGCTLTSIVSQTAVVNASTKRLASSVAIQTESKWRPWNPLVANLNPQIDGVSSAEGYVSSWANITIQHQVEGHVYLDA